MFDPANTLKYLEFYSAKQSRLEQDRRDILNSPLPQGLKDEQDVELKNQIDSIVRKKLDMLTRFALFPPHHERHQSTLSDFHKVADFEKSVFIMTKFPDPTGNTAADAQLSEVIGTVKKAVARCQLSPRVANEKDYYPSLWDNVELHLLGCSRGIAIVESCYKPELNPNVAMEWGWMRGMGRSVLYLVENGFTQKRADWGGLIEHGFSWSDPSASILDAVHKWLGCTLKH